MRHARAIKALCEPLPAFRSLFRILLARVGRHGRAKSLPEGDALNRLRELSSILAAARGHQSLRCCAPQSWLGWTLMVKQLVPRQDRRSLLIPLPTGWPACNSTPASGGSACHAVPDSALTNWR